MQILLLAQHVSAQLRRYQYYDTKGQAEASNVYQYVQVKLMYALVEDKIIKSMIKYSVCDVCYKIASSKVCQTD